MPKRFYSKQEIDQYMGARPGDWDNFLKESTEKAAALFRRNRELWNKGKERQDLSLKVKEDYFNKMKMDDIAQKHSINIRNVYKILKELNLPRRNRQLIGAEKELTEQSNNERMGEDAKSV
jgi:hypothetical protein